MKPRSVPMKILISPNVGEIAISPGLLLVPGESRVALGLNPVLLVAFGAGKLGGAPCDRLVAYLDRHIGGGPQVPVPVGVAVRSCLRGEHEVVVPVGQVHHRVDPLLPAAGTDGVKKQQRRPGEAAADPPMAGTELIDVALVELLSLAGQRLSSRLSWRRVGARCPDGVSRLRGITSSAARGRGRCACGATRRRRRRGRRTRAARRSADAVRPVRPPG
jgi:hypothetical protein